MTEKQHQQFRNEFYNLILTKFPQKVELIGDYGQLSPSNYHFYTTHPPAPKWISFSDFNDAEYQALVELVKARLVLVKAHIPSPHRRIVHTHTLLDQLLSLFPRKNREAIVGDLLEDVADYRQKGWSEWRIRCHIVYQIFFAIIQPLGNSARLGVVLGFLSKIKQRWFA